MKFNVHYMQPVLNFMYGWPDGGLMTETNLLLSFNGHFYLSLSSSKGDSVTVLNSAPCYEGM
jgi:hypothetical protein